MKIDVIDRGHIISAAQHIDIVGTPKSYIWNDYYFVVNGEEYPFKYLIREAYRIATNGQIMESFQSHGGYRSYIESLGFEMRYYPEGINFFTKSELDFYHSIANSEYRKDNLIHKYYKDKLAPIIAKVNYWAGQVCQEFPGYMVVKQANWLTAYDSRVRPYFWPRLYKGEDRDIFFNVDVNGLDRFISFKLDGYYRTSKELKPSQIEILDEFKNAGKWTWDPIPFDDVPNYNWDKLIQETTQYIRNLLDDYDRLKKLIWQESKIARITWNTNGWVKPSGRMGKSKSDSFEKRYGYGHEEWLFDSGKVIDGMKYGFLEPINKYYETYQDQAFDVSLYTIDSYTKKRFWITSLKNVEVISPEEAASVIEYYKTKGWLDEMKGDLTSEELDAKSLNVWIKKNLLFNIKFPAHQLYEIPEPIEIIQDDIPKTARYLLLDIEPAKQKTYAEQAKKGFSFENSGSDNADNLSMTALRQVRTQEPKEIVLKHNQIQKEFMKYLQTHYGNKNVKRECRAHGSARIDIVRKENSGNILYEIKTYNCLRTSIRESVGQLLEYSLYSDVGQVNKLCIVSDISPNESIKQYLSRLKNVIILPISYIQFDIDSKKIILEI